MLSEETVLKVQAERRSRLKAYHNFTNIDMKTRHFFMKKEIELLRLSQQQLLEIKQRKFN